MMKTYRKGVDVGLVMSTHRVFEEDLRMALMLVRDLREKYLRWGKDARALRVALKFALKVDDFFAKDHITEEEDKGLDELAERLFRTARG